MKRRLGFLVCGVWSLGKRWKHKSTFPSFKNSINFFLIYELDRFPCACYMYAEFFASFPQNLRQAVEVCGHVLRLRYTGINNDHCSLLTWMNSNDLKLFVEVRLYSFWTFEFCKQRTARSPFPCFRNWVYELNTHENIQNASPQHFERLAYAVPGQKGLYIKCFF